MTIQAGQNVVVARKRQSGLGVSASGGSGLGFRPNEGSPGLKLTKAIIPNNEVNRDGQKRRGRHGTRRCEGSYEENLTLVTQNDLLEAILRSTLTATFNITEATTLGGSAAATSITTTTSTIVAAAGSWLLQGVRKGMLVQLSGHATAANNGKWMRVLDVSALTITLPANTLTANAVADTAFTLIVAKYVFSGAAPLEYYHTIDEYDQDLDLTSLGTDLKLVKLEISAQPDQNVKVTSHWIGLDYTPQTTGASPVLTAPVFTTSLPMVMADGILRIGGVDYSVLTGFNIVIDLGGQAPSVLATNAPDVFLDNSMVSGSFSALKQDLGFLTSFRSETQVEFFILFQENDATDPKDFISCYVANTTLSGADGPLGSTGPRVVTVPWNAGKDESGGAAAATTVLFAMSA